MMAILLLLLLQYFLSTRQAKWPGMILPALSLLLGLEYAFVFVLAVAEIQTAAGAFLLRGVLPCLILLAVYKLGRSRLQKKNRERVEKMNLQNKQ